MKKIGSFLLSLGMSCFVLMGTTARSKYLVANGIPKCGTHLLCKALDCFTGYKLLNCGFLNFARMTSGEVKPLIEGAPILQQWREDAIMHIHMIHNNAHADFFENNTRHFFIYRDPRDQVVSFAHHIIDRYKSNKRKLLDLISYLIVDGKDWYGKGFGIKGFYEAFMPWAKDENVCTTSFEALVGSKGGGSDEAQLIETRKIANHLGLDCSNEEIEQIAAQLYGKKANDPNSNTFRKGQIGSWKEHFSETHKQFFKKHAGQLLIDLGYETDLNW